MIFLNWLLRFLGICFILYVIVPWAVRFYLDAQRGRKQGGDR